MTKQFPHEIVEDPDYFRDVIGNMIKATGKKETASVRFGLTGDGVSPHYEISGDGPLGSQTASFDGKNHKRFHSPAPFENKNLTEDFSYPEVVEMLRKALEKRNANGR